MADATQPRRWTVIASGLFCGALALVVVFTTRRAFISPLAVVVVAAIGMAAVLLQLRLRKPEPEQAVRQPVWLNIIGIICALAALFADLLHLNVDLAQALALAAVASFAVSSAIILHAVRKQRVVSK